MDNEPDATPETEGKNPNKYLILVPFTPNTGEDNEPLDGVWEEYEDQAGEVPHFLDAPEAYRYAREQQIPDAQVIKLHGRQTGQQEFKAVRELY